MRPFILPIPAVVLVVIPALPILSLLLAFILRRRRRKPTITTIRCLHVGRALLTSSPGHLTPLASRALPNQRLVTAFGIDNSFTTASYSRHKAFRSRVEHLLRMSSASWQQTSTLAQTLFRQNTSSLHLVPFVRQYVLTTILHIFFADFVPFQPDAVAELGDLIHSLWLQSKVGAPSVTSQRRLQETLRHLFPGMTENPLDLLLPAYETLWRTVMRCFLEVQFRAGEQAPAWRELLAEYLGQPSSPRFYASLDGVSPAFLVKETLRLYPPTKRIYRATTEKNWVAVDVEGLQCSPEVWGKDAEHFRPERWGEADAGTWIPFGTGTFVCPAKGEFAPRLIGILVAAMLGAVPKDARWTVEHEADDVLRGGRLNNERDGYESLKLFW
ncbi:cytochrome P450 [Sphaerosporella brunnea]|uniref:Cytochrome P450 n=1 Tax=Sphaerosporella brunnea TaxID=1250544 RepID=A0A5J5EE31_9PEZI|nr:cytochrome P450 [Sphaerosporella brunnea]KAA8893895.1 cytochrome P450 [Sphaerosporella brunnea]